MGEAGTGKSERAVYIRQILDEIGISSQIMHLDNYYRTSWKYRNSTRKNLGIDSVGLKELDWITIESHLSLFLNQRPIGYIQQLNKFTDSYELLLYNP